MAGGALENRTQKGCESNRIESCFCYTFAEVAADNPWGGLYLRSSCNLSVGCIHIEAISGNLSSVCILP